MIRCRLARWRYKAAQQQSRKKRKMIKQNLSSLPDAFSGPAAWTTKVLANSEDDWLVELSDADIAELEAAANSFLATHKDLGSITKSDFELSGFSVHLNTLKQKLVHGNGIEVIRGLPVGSYTAEFAACIFCGIGAHLGSARSQNAAGHILGHVRDQGASSSDPETRIYQTSERQSFHTDSADVVGLLCLNSAQSGGDSLLVSALSIYNEMHKLRPDLLELLFEPIATDRRGEVPPGEKPYMDIPVFNWYENQLTVFYQRQYIESAQRFDDAPRLTAKHIEALDLFDTLANDPDLHFVMRLERGDMQFVYNHSQLHDRTGFIDWPTPEQRRHMLRLWLSVDNDRPLPGYFKQRYGSIEIGNRGGIITNNTSLQAPVWD